MKKLKIEDILQTLNEVVLETIEFIISYRGPDSTQNNKHWYIIEWHHADWCLNDSYTKRIRIVLNNNGFGLLTNLKEKYVFYKKSELKKILENIRLKNTNVV